MEEARFTAIYRRQYIGQGRTRHIIADADTGAIIGQWHTGDPEVVFEQGGSACLCEVMLGMERTANGDCWYVSLPEPDGLTLRPLGLFWRQKDGAVRRKPKTAKKANVYVVINAAADKLTEEELGAAIKLARNADNDGLLPGDIPAAMGWSERTTYRRLKRLRELNIVQTDAEGRFFIAQKEAAHA
jgi:hypothetical protein